MALLFSQYSESQSVFLFLAPLSNTYSLRISFETSILFYWSIRQGQDVGVENPCIKLVGLLINSALMEKIIEISQKREKN